jgi:formylmethanofuran dehydrogenase subunit D
MNFILNTVRKIDNDQTKEHAFGTEQSLKDNLAVCFINPKDFEKLNLSTSLNLTIANNEKEVIVKVEKDEDVPEGTVAMPVSIWSNRLTEVQGDDLLYKNISVSAEATRDSITTFEEIMNKIGVKK